MEFCAVISGFPTVRKELSNNTQGADTKVLVPLLLRTYTADGAAPRYWRPRSFDAALNDLSNPGVLNE
jgi:hypothetical protein